MNKDKLSKILDDHRLWLESDFAKGVRADLREANLCEADLRWADLRGSDLYKADLCKADLYKADLREANLCEADLRWADLCEADLRWADLRGSDLYKADLRWADLRRANLRGADLRWAEGIIYMPCGEYEIFYNGRLIGLGCMWHTLDEWLAMPIDKVWEYDNNINVAWFERLKKVLPSIPELYDLWQAL